MKTILSAVMILLLHFACGTKTEISTLEGKWNLENVSGGLLGVNIDFAKGEVVWNFQTNPNILVVTETFTTDEPDNDYSPLSPGSYEYEELKLNGKTYIEFKNPALTSGRYFITENGKLIFDPNDQAYASGADFFISSFVR